MEGNPTVSASPEQTNEPTKTNHSERPIHANIPRLQTENLPFPTHPPASGVENIVGHFDQPFGSSTNYVIWVLILFADFYKLSMSKFDLLII